MRWVLFFLGWGAVIVFLALFVIGSLPAGGNPQQVAIEPGTSRVEIAQILKDKKIIRSKLSFLVMLSFMGGTVEAGSYQLNPSRHIGVIIASMRTGKNQFIRLTIPEGWRREQIAAELTKQGLDGPGFLAATTDKEGYLFPDTYFLAHDASVEAILGKFADNFTERTKNLKPTREQVILASLVEREAKHDSERAVIAGIYTNRRKIGMPLQCDPTVQYAKVTNMLNSGESVTNFWPEITQEDYRTATSPYNTYLHANYPPGPIANPGLASLEAALHPGQTNALYFFYTKDDQLVTAVTLEERNRLLQKYE